MGAVLTSIVAFPALPSTSPAIWSGEVDTSKVPRTAAQGSGWDRSRTLAPFQGSGVPWPSASLDWKGGEKDMGVFRKNGSWWIDYRAGGQRRREKIGPSKALAEKVHAKRQVEIAEGKFLGIRKEHKYSFAEATDRFLTYSQANKRSYLRDVLSVRKHLLPVFGEKLLSQIGSWDVEKYKAMRKTHVSNGSVNRELACLKTIFNKSVLWGMASTNPVKGVRFFPEKRRLRFLMPDEIQILLEACSDDFRTIVLTALNTGMRRGEILNLTWDDVDLERRQLLVRDSKNGESRTVEMNDLLTETLKLHMSQQRPRPTNVFVGRTGAPLTTIQHTFERTCQRAGLTDLHFHDLRHTFASHLVMNGIDLTTVKELLGHKSIQMTLRYAHLSQPHKKKAVETLSGVMGGHYLDTKPALAVSAHPRHGC